MANTFKFGNGEWARKTGQVLAYNSENDNYKPLPFTFDRASSATRVNKEGLIETVSVDEPRIDFLNNSKGHLLLEPQRQNIITYSEDFSDSSYLKTNCTITSNNSISPDGTQNADKLNFTTSNGYIVRTTSFTSGQEYTMSFYAKTESGTLDFTYGNMDYVSISGTATTEWQRFEITQTLPVSTRYPKIQTTEIGSLLLWGWQVEQGSYATSYIPTSGSAVTRSAETCNNAGNSTVFNDSEGVLYLETKPITDNYANNGVSFSSQINLSDGNLNNGANIRFRGTVLQCLYYNGSGYTAVLDYLNISVTETYKVAFLYKQNDFKMYVNGVLTDSDTFGSIGSFTLDRVTFDNSNGVNLFYGKVTDLRVYNTALTDAELIALTS